MCVPKLCRGGGNTHWHLSSQCLLPAKHRQYRATTGRKTSRTVESISLSGMTCVLDPTITLLVETTRVGGLSIYIAGKVGRAEDRSEGSIGKFSIADVIGHYE